MVTNLQINQQLQQWKIFCLSKKYCLVSFLKWILFFFYFCPFGWTFHRNLNGHFCFCLMPRFCQFSFLFPFLWRILQTVQSLSTFVQFSALILSTVNISLCFLLSNSSANSSCLCVYFLRLSICFKVKTEKWKVGKQGYDKCWAQQRNGLGTNEVQTKRNFFWD